MRCRAMALILSASLAAWVLLGVTVAPLLGLQTVTLIAAGVIIATQTGALLYACWLSPAPYQRGLDHLDWLARLCTILGLLGTVAGFSAELRTLHGIHGGVDPSSALDLVGRMALGFGTSMVSTFTGILAYATISLAEHVLQGRQ